MPSLGWITTANISVTRLATKITLTLFLGTEQLGVFCFLLQALKFLLSRLSLISSDRQMLGQSFTWKTRKLLFFQLLFDTFLKLLDPVPRKAHETTSPNINIP